MEALLLAAIFASHAGDGRLSQEILGNLTDAAVASRPELQVRKLIYEATGTIDNDPAAAEALAARSVTLCAALSGDDHAALLGQALGTAGRARLHGGRPEQAEPLLHKALDHHRKWLPSEWPRSASYLATCLRHARRAPEALELTRRALAETERSAARSDMAETTALYLHLERGRCLAALGQPADAARDFERVIAGQSLPAAYPRLGAHRLLAGLLALGGHADEARAHLRVCLEVAAGSGTSTLRRVGAVAAGEALLSGTPLLPVWELEAAWEAGFPGVDREQVLRTWIY